VLVAQPIILATQSQRSGGSQFKASLGKQFLRPYREKPYHKKLAQGEGPEFKKNKIITKK
jgi:hypothetical protein